MTLVRRVTGLGVGLALAFAVPTVTLGRQEGSALPEMGGPFTGPSVRDAPFSADATTTVRETLHDGTRIDQTSSARYYRDRAGRVRVEQTLVNLEGVNPAAEKHVRITIQPKHDGLAVYVLDPLTRTAVLGGPRAFGDVTVGGGNMFALPLGIPTILSFSRPASARDHLVNRGQIDIQEESLGDRRVAGIDTVGRRRTGMVPRYQIGNDRPVEIVDERWESPELTLVIYSRSSDSRTGTIEYRLANIQRTEPDPSLFVIPEDYTFRFTADTRCTTLVYADNHLDPERPLYIQLREANSPGPIVRNADATFSCR
jgi:hypothetical protein